MVCTIPQSGESTEPLGDLAVRVSPNTTTLLVVAASKWVLYSAGSFHQLHVVAAREDDAWQDGWFVDDLHVAMSTKVCVFCACFVCISVRYFLWYACFSLWL